MSRAEDGDYLYHSFDRSLSGFIFWAHSVGVESKWFTKIILLPSVELCMSSGFCAYPVVWTRGTRWWHVLYTMLAQS